MLVRRYCAGTDVRRLLIVAVLAICIWPLCSMPLAGEELQWTGPSGAGTWSSPANWTNLTVGGTATVPDGDDDVIFPVDVSTGNGSAFNLTNAATLSVAVNTGISLNGTSITNTGTFTFVSDGFDNIGGLPDTRITIQSNIALSGEGTLQFAGSETGIAGSGTLTNLDNTIRGVGVIQTDLINQGTVRSEGGTLLVTGGSLFTNTGGMIEIAADGVLDLQSSNLTGGNLTATAGGLIAGGGLDGVTIIGTLTQATNRTTTWAGTISNLGTVTFANDSFDHIGDVLDTRFLIDGDVTLTGGGDIVLTGNQTGLEGAGLLINSNNTIHAGNSAVLAVALQNGAAGVVDIGDGKRLVLDAGVSGGTFHSNANGVLASTDGGQLSDLTITGIVTQEANNGTALAGTISNNGTITFQSDSFDNFGGFPDTRFTINGETSLTGVGEVVLTHAETGLTGTGTLTNVSNTIRGRGQIQVNLVNQSNVVVESGLIRVNSGVELDNNAGTVAIAANGRLDLGNSTLAGGNLAATSGATILGGAIQDVTVTGTLTEVANQSTAWEGTIENQGVLTFEPDTFNNFAGVPDTRFVIDSAVLLTGGGSIVLNGLENGLSGAGTLTNEDNTIRGVGELQVNLVNNATVRAEGGTLAVTNGVAFGNASGLVEIAADGVLDLGTSPLEGGNLSTVAGGQIAKGTLRNVSISGTVTESINQGTQLEGTITNTGMLTFFNDSTNNLGGIPDTRYTIDSTVTLTGGGSITLLGSETGLIGSGLLVNMNNTIHAGESGILSVDIQNGAAGTIALGAGKRLVLDGEISGGMVTADATAVLNSTGNALLRDLAVSGTLVQEVNNTTPLAGTVANQGIVAFQADNTNNFGGVPDTRLTVNGNVNLTGGGQIVLAGSETGIAGPGVLTNVNNVIHGNGQLQVNLVNEHVVRAEAGALRIIDGVTLDNSAGDFEIAADGILDLGTSTLVGGGLDSALGSLLLAGTLKNVELIGTVTEMVNQGTVLEGTITNRGVMTFVNDTTNNIGGIPDTRYTFNSAVTLTGGGRIDLLGSETGLAGSGVLHNLDNTIEAGSSGIISVSVQNGSGGIISLGAARTLTLDASVSGGTLTGDAAGVLTSTDRGVLRDLTLMGQLTLAINDTTLLAGTIDNQGIFGFTADATNNFGGIPDTRYTIDQQLSLSGGGTVQLHGTETGLAGGGLLTNLDNVIQGVGELQVHTLNEGVIRADGGRLLVTRNVTGAGTLQAAPGAELEMNTPLISTHTVTVDATGVFDFNGSRLEVVNFQGDLPLDVGTFAPGQQIGESTLSGSLQMGPASKLELQLAGFAAGEFDHLTVGNSATTDGELIVRAVQQVSSIGGSATLTILSAGSLAGSFDTLPVAADHLGYGLFLNSLVFDIANDVIQISVSQDLLPGDFDSDGDVDGADLTRWQGGYGTSSPTLADGDADANGLVDGADYLIWQRHFGTSIANANAVPEPHTCALLIASLGGCLGIRVRTATMSCGKAPKS